MAFQTRAMSRFATSDRARQGKSNVYLYSTPDSAADVMAPDYFRAAIRSFNLRQGDIIFCTTGVDAVPGLSMLTITAATKTAITLLNAVTGAIGGGTGAAATLKAIGGYQTVPVSTFAVSGAKTRIKERMLFKVWRAASKIGIVHVNAFLAGGTSGVTNGPNAFTIRKGAFEKVGGVTVPCTWGGVATDIAVPAGALKHMSDQIDFATVPGDTVAWRASYDVPAGGSYPVGAWNLSPGDQLNIYDPAGEVDDVYGTGTMAVPSGATVSGRALSPALLFGLTSDGNWSVIGIGTSIDAGQNCEIPDQALGIGGGYIARAAMAKQRPYMNYALNGYQFFSITARHDLLDGLLEFFDEGVLGAPTNDLYNQGLSSIDSVVARWNTVAGYCKAGGIKRVHGATMLPRGTCTDKGVLASNFTPFTEYASGGLRDQFNTALKAKGAAFSNFDNVVDVSAAIELPTDKNRWIEFPFSAMLSQAATAPTASVQMGAAPALYAQLAFDPFNTAGQQGPATLWAVRQVTGTGPYTVSSLVTNLTVSQNMLNLVRERSSDGGTHPVERPSALMAVPLTAALH